MTIDTSDSAFIDAFDEVVANAGRDFIYDPDEETESCYYVKDGKADCVIGRTLHALGVPLTELRKYDPDTDHHLIDRNGMRTVNPSARELLPHYGFSERVAIAAGSAQNEQDRGAAWGHVSDLFHREVDTF